MFSSFSYCAINCHPCFIVLLLTVFAFIICDIHPDYKYVNSIGFTMPVTMRSQARLLLNNCNEHLQVCLECSPVLTQDSSNTISSSSMTQLTSPALLSPSSSTSLLLGSSQQNSSLVNFDTSSLDGGSSLSKFQILEFSNSTFEDTQPVTSPVALFSHTSSCGNFSNMEADCQDTKMESSPNPDPPDLIQNNYLHHCLLIFPFRQIEFKLRFNKMMRN